MFFHIDIDALKQDKSKKMLPDIARIVSKTTVNTLDARSKAEKVAEDVARLKYQYVNSTTIQEFGGPKGLEPTRYGDWEKAGRCIDF